MFFFFCTTFFFLRVKKDDKMKDEDSSSPFEAFQSILILLMRLFIQELFLKRKDCERHRKSTAIYHHTWRSSHYLWPAEWFWYTINHYLLMACD